MPRRPPLLPTLAALALCTLAGCATTGSKGRSLIPTGFRTVTGPYTIHTNFPLDPEAPAVGHLQSLQRQIESTLGVRVDPGESPIDVFILDDRKAFTHFLTFYYPELPPRRAFFFAQGPRRVVYTYLGDRLEEDLRHEATHALMHAAFADLPLWLDEGLAEYFEVAESRHGLNAEHLDRLPEDLARGWSPDLRHLETLEDVRQMTPRDYRESWAWVHYLLHSGPRTKVALLAHLAAIRDGQAPSLADRLDAAGPTPEAPMLAHLDVLRQRREAFAAGPSAPVPAAPATVRLQNDPSPGYVGPAPAPAPASAPPPRRRGFFGRLADGLFGRREPEPGPLP